MSVSVLCLVIAAVLFALGVAIKPARFNLISAGLFFWVLSILAGHIR